MNRECFDKHVDVFRTGVFGALHNFRFMYEVFDRLIFEVALNVVVKLVNVDDFDSDNVFGWQVVAIQ